MFISLVVWFFNVVQLQVFNLDTVRKVLKILLLLFYINRISVKIVSLNGGANMDNIHKNPYYLNINFKICCVLSVIFSCGYIVKNFRNRRSI